MALRMAQEVGAHRLRSLKDPTAENELWKRAFWSLFSLVLLPTQSDLSNDFSQGASHA
jgi:hypothetical protein